jgi:HMG box factor
MVMTIPFINKIRVLAKISPPLLSSPTKSESSGRGALVAVEGQDLGLVNTMVQYLKKLLSKDEGHLVQVFKGPEISLEQLSAKSDEMSEATVQYLDTISAWHKISDEIVNFINVPSTTTDCQSGSGAPISGISTEPIVPKTVELDVNSLGNSATTTRDSALHIALVPRYQLTTADAHACATPINDAYAPIDHWQWMASLWRGCVGPDITVYIRDCEQEELDKFGNGNPVEIRLSDARALIVRRLVDSGKGIEEKALRRVGFEVEEFLRK